ncbi:uncharacterized protein LOC116265396 isoform X1 [Nymphaea colorata]|nr:uncharacterized protein LOC116265396 isoform X1 [Nymphaea colorata]
MVGSSDICLGSSDISAASLPINRKLLTLAVVNDGSRVLLGLKKRGFGEGYYNGFGGKVEEGETIDQAAVRELKEEAGISPIGMTKLGILIFHFDDKPCPWEVHVFNVPEFTGEPCESDEMLPTWFAHEQIPFEQMWKDDTVWYPLFLKGQKFKGEFFFQDTHKLFSYKCEAVESL